MDEKKTNLTPEEMAGVSGGSNLPRKYRCSKPGCTYTYEGTEPPKYCPRCGGLVGIFTGFPPKGHNA